MSDDLPTIEQCREFLATVNRGREAIGLPALETLEFDACEPGDPRNCLSAHHVFTPAGYSVGANDVCAVAGEDDKLIGNPAACVAMGMPQTNANIFRLTHAIRDVTDCFDLIPCLEDLRLRMVEAGVVD